MRLPLVDALVDVRADMLEVVEAMLEEDRVRLCGPKHARVPGLTS